MYEIYKRLLDEKGLKNSDVSRATGISNMTLSDWKRGVSKPKEDKMKKIADFLGVTVAYLMGWEDEEIKSKATRDAEMLNSWIPHPDSELYKIIKENISAQIVSLISPELRKTMELAERIMALTENDKKTVYNMVDEMSNKKEGKE